MREYRKIWREEMRVKIKDEIYREKVDNFPPENPYQSKIPLHLIHNCILLLNIFRFKFW